MRACFAAVNDKVEGERDRTLKNAIRCSLDNGRYICGALGRWWWKNVESRAMNKISIFQQHSVNWRDDIFSLSTFFQFKSRKSEARWAIIKGKLLFFVCLLWSVILCKFPVNGVGLCWKFSFLSFRSLLTMTTVFRVFRFFVLLFRNTTIILKLS